MKKLQWKRGRPLLCWKTTVTKDIANQGCICNSLIRMLLQIIEKRRIQCARYTLIYGWENTTSIYVKCESNVDFNSGVCNCLIILLHKHGVNLSECLTASGFKMAGISITFIWSLCHHLSGSLAKSFLKIVIYFIRAVEQIFSIYYKIQYTQWNLGLKERKWKHWNTMEVNCIIKENVIIVLF